jgi:hypothetical protein
MNSDTPRTEAIKRLREEVAINSPASESDGRDQFSMDILLVCVAVEQLELERELIASKEKLVLMESQSQTQTLLKINDGLEQELATKEKELTKLQEKLEYCVTECIQLTNEKYQLQEVARELARVLFTYSVRLDISHNAGICDSLDTYNNLPASIRGEKGSENI